MQLGRALSSGRRSSTRSETASGGVSHRFLQGTSLRLVQKRSVTRAVQARCRNNSRAATAPLSQSRSAQEGEMVDGELWEVLELADQVELQGLYSILFGSSPFSPVLKSLTRAEPVPTRQAALTRRQVMRQLEARFRFLAADALSTLRGKQPSYREALLCVRAKLSVPCPDSASTQDLELEIFNQIVAHFKELMPHTEAPRRSAAGKGGAGGVVNDFANLPPIKWGRRLRSSSGAFLSHLTAPMSLSLGVDSVLPTLSKLGGAVACAGTAARVAVSNPKVAGPAITSSARICLSLAASKGPLSVQGKLALETVSKGTALTAGRFGALQGALAFAGPALWAWFAADVALASVGTDYARLTRATFALAQIRLLRTAGFQNPPPKLGN